MEKEEHNMGTAMSRNFNQLVHDAAVAPWNLAVEPFKVAPRIYYVGNVWVGAYLIDTEEGLILLDASVFETAYQLIDSIYQLGFNPTTSNTSWFRISTLTTTAPPRPCAS